LWIKLANRSPMAIFPDHAEDLRDDLHAIVQIAKARYPNLSIVYLSSRTRAYTTGPGVNPEPVAYETGFAVKWLIEDQISGALPPEPWLAWGPYLWADGLEPRSDGFIWECRDLRQTDLIHPDPAGSTKVARELLDFLREHPSSRSWFRVPEPTPIVLRVAALATLAALTAPGRRRPGRGA
jgi:hypothetical protein